MNDTIGLIGNRIRYWIGHRLHPLKVTETEWASAPAGLEQLHFLLRVNRRLAEVDDEDTLARLALQFPAEVAPIHGCVLIRFDAHEQPMPMEHSGAVALEELTAWQEQLARKDLLEACRHCHQLHRFRQEGCSVLLYGSPRDECPIFRGAPSTASRQDVTCWSLEWQDRRLGQLSLFLEAGRALSPHQKTLLDALASEISLAFANIRLRSRSLQALADINEVLHLHLDLPGQLQQALVHTMTAMGADAGLIWLEAPEEPALRLYGRAGQWQNVRPPVAVEKLAQAALEKEEPLRITHLQIAEQEAINSLMCAPIGHHQSERRGVLVLYSDQNHFFTPIRARLTMAAAHHIALLVENNHLYARAHHQIGGEERERLARELHDGLAQNLGYLKLRGQQLRHWLEEQQLDLARAGVEEIISVVDESYQELRQALDRLRQPEGACQQSFAQRLRALIDSLPGQADLPVSIDIRCAPGLFPEAEAQLLRFVQEALNNIVQHARARHAWLRLQKEQDAWVVLEIGDNGRGFDPDRAAPSGHYGLQNLQERARLLHADLTIDSHPGEGTRLFLRWRPTLAWQETRNGDKE